MQTYVVNIFEYQKFNNRILKCSYKKMVSKTSGKNNYQQASLDVSLDTFLTLPYQCMMLMFYE